MSYYHQPSTTERGPGRLETKLSDGAQLGPPDSGWTPELAALCGFVVIAETARPADTATQTSDRTLTFPGGVPTVTWTVRPKTQAELDAATRQTNRATIEARALTIIGQMDTIVASSGTLTAAQLSGAVRQIAAGLRGLVRFSMNQLDSPD